MLDLEKELSYYSCLNGRVLEEEDEKNMIDVHYWLVCKDVLTHTIWLEWLTLLVIKK